MEEGGEKGEVEVTASLILDEQGCLNQVGEDGGREEQEEQEKEEDEEEEGEEEDEDYAFRFESGMNPLDFTHEDAGGLQPYQRFERLEYEALAEKKRKALANHHGSKYAYFLLPIFS